MIKLYHYSQADFTGHIKPSFFGSNNYTNESRDISQVKRAFFYADDKSREYFFNGSRFVYIAEINEKKVYDIVKDVLGLENLCYNNLKDIYTEIKRRGYRGVKGNNGFDCICLFYPVKAIDKITLTK
jgi:hypothetical protein